MAETFEKMMNEFDDELHDEKKMRKLSCMINYFVEEVKEKSPKLAEDFLIKVNLLLNPHFTRETAEYAVHCMKNKDGTTGEHWDYETTTKVLESRDLNFKKSDWYYVLNMIYSDYYKYGRSDDTYIELAEDFLDDPDGPEHKAKKYYQMLKE